MAFEGQFRGYYKESTHVPGVSGENLLRLLESRLNNVIYRLGFAPSRKAARQLITSTITFLLMDAGSIFPFLLNKSW